MDSSHSHLPGLLLSCLLTACLPGVAPIQSANAFLVPALRQSTNASTETLNAKLAAQIDEYMAAVAALGRFSGSILVAKQGKVVISKGYGSANLEHQIPNGPQTKFRIASLTKQFTAMEVLILQEKGLLNVEDGVCKYLGDCPEPWQKITLHHLLTMTSGIPNFQNFPDNERFERLPTTVEATIDRFKGKPLEFPPGERLSYSSSGYVLLGHVIERITGERFEDVLKKHIFVPLGMRNSGYDHPQTVLVDRASGYARQGTRFANAVHFEMDTPHAAGALYSTVEDLYMWDQALYTTKLVSKASLASMFTPFKDSYAYGWAVTEQQGRKVVMHSGAISGFRSLIMRFPEEHVCIILLNNFEFATLRGPRQDIPAIILGTSYKVPQEASGIRLDQETAAQYVGRYRSANWEIIITKEDDRLMFHPSVGSRSYFELHAATENSFFVTELELSFTAVQDEEGRVTHLLTEWGKLEKVNSGGRRRSATSALPGLTHSWRWTRDRRISLTRRSSRRPTNTTADHDWSQVTAAWNLRIHQGPDKKVGVRQRADCVLPMRRRGRPAGLAAERESAPLRGAPSLGCGSVSRN